MSLTLELKPEEEIALRSFADAEGVTLDQFIARLLKGYQPAVGADVQAEPGWKVKLRAGQQIMGRAFAASGITDDELAEDVQAEVNAYRAERAQAEATQSPQPSF